MAKRKNREKVSVDGAEQELVAPILGDMLRDAGYASSASPKAHPPDPEPELTKETGQKTCGGEMPDLAKSGKLVLRRERKGRRGKTVTVLTGNSLPAGSLESLAKAMRKGLGCGSRVEGETIVLQGEIADRASEWLRQRGARNVVCG